MTIREIYVEVDEKLLTDHEGRECGGAPGPHVIEDGPVDEFQILPKHKGALLCWLRWADLQRQKAGVSEMKDERIPWYRIVNWFKRLFTWRKDAPNKSR